MTRYHWIGAPALLLVVSMSGWGCPGTTSFGARLDPDSPSGREFQQIRSLIQPYDLDRSTAEGLERLDEWIEQNWGKNPAPGLLLRANTQLDLWLYGLMTIGVDDLAAAAALDLLARRVGLPDAFDEGPDDESLERVSRQLAEWVTQDYDEAGVEERQVDLAWDFFEYRPWDEDAPALFRRHWDTASSTPRMRLLLAALLDRRPGPWSGRRVQDLGQVFLRDYSWLCSDDSMDSIEELADGCGFWCARLPQGQVVVPTQGPRSREEWIEDEVAYAEDQEALPGPAGEMPGEIPSAEANESAAAAWDPTPGDIGYELVRACGGDYFGLPRTGGVVLLDEAVYVDLVFLSFVGRLMTEIERDLADGEPLTRLSSDLVAQFSSRVLSHPVPSRLTPAAYRYDPRLELARIHGPGMGDFSVVEVDEAFVTMRSDGLYLGLGPHLQLEREDGVYRVVYAESALGCHFPGQRVVAFSAMNQMGAEQIESGRIPALAAALEELDRRVEETDWLAGASRLHPGSRDMGEQDVPVLDIFLLIDASTYADTFKPVVATLLDAGYRPHILVLGDDEEELQVLEWSFSTTGGVEGLQLRLSEGQLSLHRGGLDGADQVELFQVERLCGTPYLVLYQDLLARAQAGEFDPDRPLVFELLDDRIDFGILVHLYEAVAYQREITAVSSDAELLAAPILVEGGSPLDLVAGGVVFSW